MDSQRASRDERILTSVAESIGATLGTIAAKAGSVQKELTKRVTAAKPRARRAVKEAAKRVKLQGKTARKTRAGASTARRTKRNVVAG
ncbi:MAG: hypothetical protein JWO71_2797 [Candidatus Acidoferrum typicum]|nr:hypothetical protein [Candidatus Acidoferrum typicum]